MLKAMNRSRIFRLGRLLLSVGSAVVALVAALLGVLLEAFTSIDSEPDDERQLHDSDLSGELNYRTGRLDSGTDPHGWYDRD